MNKMERAFDTLCIAAIPFFLLLAAVSLQMEGKKEIAIMAIAFSMILLLVHHMVSQVFWIYPNTKQSKPEAEELTHTIHELEERVQKLERRIAILARDQNTIAKYYERMKPKEEKQKEEQKKEEKPKEKQKKEEQKKEKIPKQLQPVLNVAENLEKENAEPQNETGQNILVNLDTEVLDQIREFGSNDKIRIYREGMGKYSLINFRELWPEDIMTGEIFTQEAYDIFRACGMEKIFTLNSQNVIDHKILKVRPAIIHMPNIDESGNEFWGELMQKGEIEVNNHM